MPEQFEADGFEAYGFEDGCSRIIGSPGARIAAGLARNTAALPLQLMCST